MRFGGVSLRQIIRKPGSVLSGHLSSSDVAIGLKRVLVMNSGGTPAGLAG